MLAARKILGSIRHPCFLALITNKHHTTPSVVPSSFMCCFKDRLKCIFWQEWHDRLDNSSRAIFYRAIRNVPQYQMYLEYVHVKAHRQALTRLLTSSHALRVETGRWDRPVTPRVRRFCIVCNIIEDEYHFMLECPLYSDIRTKFIPRQFHTRPSMFKLSQLINTCNERQIRGVAKFTHFAFKIRDSHINLRTNSDS